MKHCCRIFISLPIVEGWKRSQKHRGRGIELTDKQIQLAAPLGGTWTIASGV
jgi:hypothetical protein